MPEKIKCIIFDLDGVITETSKQHFEAWCHMAEELDIHLDPSFEEELKGVSRKESIEKILQYGQVTLDEASKEKYQAQKNTHYQKLISQFSPDDLFEGILDLLQFLKHKEIKVVLGSASKNGPNLIKALGIESYFDYVVDPSKCRSKPAPDIFLAASDYFSIPAAQCWAVEDAVAGVEAIKSAGMYAIGIGEEKNLKEADIVFTTTLQAADWMMKQF